MEATSWGGNESRRPPRAALGLLATGEQKKSSLTGRHRFRANMIRPLFLSTHRFQMFYPTFGSEYQGCSKTSCFKRLPQHAPRFRLFFCCSRFLAWEAGIFHVPLPFRIFPQPPPPHPHSSPASPLLAFVHFAASCRGGYQKKESKKSRFDSKTHLCIFYLVSACMPCQCPHWPTCFFFFFLRPPFGNKTIRWA